MTGFRFSHNIFGITGSGVFAETCRRAEQGGYDAVYAADHLGTASPFPLLVAAAAATERLRVGTLVLNVGFWNPALLAREIATTDVLTEGPLEIGLGAGHMKWEFDAAGIDWEPFGARVDRLAATVDELRRQFRADGYEQQAALRENFGVPVLRPVQRAGFDGSGPPRLIGGTGERVRFTRAQAGARAADPEWQALVQAVIETDDRRTAAGELAASLGGVMTERDLLDTPFVLVGRSTRWPARSSRTASATASRTTPHQPHAEAFAPVIARVRALEG